MKKGLSVIVHKTASITHNTNNGKTSVPLSSTNKYADVVNEKCNDSSVSLLIPPDCNQTRNVIEENAKNKNKNVAAKRCRR